ASLRCAAGIRGQLDRSARRGDLDDPGSHRAGEHHREHPCARRRADGTGGRVESRVMTAIWIRAMNELRARWRAWLAIALMLGIAGGVVMAAAAGARRTDSA